MRFHVVIVLAVVFAAAPTAEAFRSRSYRSSRRSYRSSRSMYNRRLSPSLMGALYFGYVSRYPSHFSYRRSSWGLTGSSCANYMALPNGSFVGVFRCPFLSDEPASWTRCCGYAAEGFCCDPSYDDSWKYSKLSIIAILMIVGGCLVGLGFLCFAIFACVRKKILINSRTTATVAASTCVRVQQPFTTAQIMKPPLKEDDGSFPSQPPPYPTMGYGYGGMPEASEGAAANYLGGASPAGPAVNPGFEPTPPYSMYPPPPYASGGQQDRGGGAPQPAMRGTGNPRNLPDIEEPLPTKQ